MKENTNHKSVEGSAGSQFFKVSVGFFAVAASVIGCWAIVSLCAGTISSNGFIGLMKNFIAAISG